MKAKKFNHPATFFVWYTALNTQKNPQLGQLPQDRCFLTFSIRIRSVTSDIH
jgi:hypothetical protein